MSEAAVNEPITEDRPVPELDPVTKPYWEATKRGELLIQECPKCKHRQFYPRAICVKCGSEPGWLKAKGEGVVHTYSIVRQTGAHPFNQWTPFVVAIIELDEGPRMEGNVVGCPVDDVHIGMKVKVDFVELNEEASLPFWRPAT